MTESVWIDGDIIVNKAAFAAERSGTDEAHTLKLFKDYVKQIEVNARTIGPRNSNMFWGIQGKGNYRYDLAKIRPYKGNRKMAAKPKHLEAIRNWLIDNKTTSVVDKLETDDWLGINAIPELDWIMSNDKDLLQIPGCHLRLTSGANMNRMMVLPEEANLNFYRAMLAGDATDNILGCPGVGKVTAEKLLPFDLRGNSIEMCHVVREMYLKWMEKAAWKRSQTLSNEEMLEMVNILTDENASLLWIQRPDEPVWVPPYHISAQI